MSREAFLVYYAVDDRVTVTALGAETGEQRWQLTHRDGERSHRVERNRLVRHEDTTRIGWVCDTQSLDGRPHGHDDSAGRFPSRRVKRRLDA